MKLELTIEGLLSEAVLERIRGQTVKHGLPHTVPTVDKEPEYYFAVDGFVPELMRGVAYRRARNFEARGKKVLKCPYCGNTFESVDKETKVELRCYARGSDVPLKEFSWCRECHGKVGIIYRSA
ncbi:MAG: hypothetical protein LBS19_03925 [Clostridiales bacterium]|jgi:hypothetical protein|nr:hypothetical protein [Clostridiales bacterium]